MATAGMGTSRWKARWLVRCRSFAGTWRDLRDDFYPNFRLKQIPQHMFQETISQMRNLRFFLIRSLQKLSGPLLRQYIKKTEQNMGRKSSRGIDQMMLTMNRHDVNRSTSWSVDRHDWMFFLMRLRHFMSIVTIKKPLFGNRWVESVELICYNKRTDASTNSLPTLIPCLTSFRSPKKNHVHFVHYVHFVTDGYIYI